MKSGKFFSIPEVPGDLDVLRRRAKPLDANTHPKWLQPVDANYYRYLGSVLAAGLTPTDREQFEHEKMELESAGLVADEDSKDPQLWHIYIRSTADYDTWSIGIFTGASFCELNSPADIANPVLTRDKVSDATAVFVADPFMVRNENCWFMFFELLNWHSNKGEIGLATSSDGIDWRYQQRVLVEPFHLSYPYVFEDRGSYYMIPESRQAGSIRLYCAAAFPTDWTLIDVLLDSANLVDASVFLKDEMWWMLVGDVSQKDCPTLRLFFANQLTGPWQEHAASPVVQNNARSARPAGRVLVTEGRVVRFAQNCETEYGLDVRAFEISELTRRTYREMELASNPVLRGSGGGWNACGMHHIDVHRVANHTWLACVDGWTRSY